MAAAAVAAAAAATDRPRRHLDSPSMLDALGTEASSCTRCALSQSRTQVVFGNGHPNADLMFVGEAPGFHEDQQGIPFVGQAGKLLDKLLARHRPDTRRRLRREHAQVPPARQPRPAAGGEAAVRAVAVQADRADQAEGRRHLGQLRDEAADRQGDRDHAHPRRAAAGGYGPATVTALPALPPGGSALHAGDVEGARGGLREAAGAAGAARSSRSRRSQSWWASPTLEPAAVQLGLF